MNLAKQLLFILLSFFVLIEETKATHGIGGNLRFENVGPNQYKFKLKLYRDNINGTPVMPTQVQVRIYEQGTLNWVQDALANRTTIGILSIGDSCITPNPSVIEVEEGIFESLIYTLPDNPNGYLILVKISDRNILSINFDQPEVKPMNLIAMISDPAMGGNSSPIFGPYPNDIYFCTNFTRNIQYPIIDPDGDSLVYSLVEPLSSVQTIPLGSYPYHTTIQWSPNHNISQILGPGSSMAVNPVTGVITATPSIQGHYGFALRVEEFRNGAKIGETTRELQYMTVNCPCIGVGIDEQNANNVKLYPNPTLGNFSVDLGELKTNLTATVTNALGQVISKEQFASTDHINLNIDAPKGIYFLRLKTEDGEVIDKKIIKE